MLLLETHHCCSCFYTIQLHIMPVFCPPDWPQHDKHAICSTLCSHPRKRQPHEGCLASFSTRNYNIGFHKNLRTIALSPPRCNHYQTYYKEQLRKGFEGATALVLGATAKQSSSETTCESKQTHPSCTFQNRKKNCT